jgi:bifunctional non-homologous end joining protein LigD
MTDFRPMLAVSASTLPTGADWTYEVKWDGYRALAIKDGGRVRLLSRNQKDLTRDYPAIAVAIGQLSASQVVLDGELVAIDAEGRPSFQALQHRATTDLALVYYAFDLLELDGKPWTRQPLEVRRQQLASVVVGSRVLLSEPLPGTVPEIERTVRQHGLEGIIAKRRGSIYRPGQRSDDWVKVKLSPRQEFVIGGYKPAGDTFDSVLVGYYDAGKLFFAGKVRAGFTPHTCSDVLRRIARFPRRSCPFANLPNSMGRSRLGGRDHRGGHGHTAMGPAIVVEVSFVEWTRDASLRHAAFVAVRDDKRPLEVRRENGRTG